MSVVFLLALLCIFFLSILTINSAIKIRREKRHIAELEKKLTHTSQTLHQTEALLEEEQVKCNAMVGSLADGLIMIDARNNLQTINQAAKQFLSIKHEHIETMDVLSALPIHVDFNSKIALAMHHNQVLEVKNVHIDNKQFKFHISPISDTSGKTLGAVLLMRDETLTNSVPRMKEDFTNILVHELRNPLTSIKDSSELLISAMTFSPDEQHKLLHVIFQQSNKLLSEVQQILDAAKLEAGVFTLHKKTADLKPLIAEVTNTFQKEAQEKMINYIVDLDFNFPTFSFDPKYMHQVLNNLLSNSIKFTSHGGTIRISTKQNTGRAVITIADTGAGIPKEKQHKLFHKFSQLEEASATVGKGLGLYLVKGIIEAHGGTVDIDSDKGRGTTVTITLPLIDATHASAPAKHIADSQRMLN